ncbi:MAG TPA: type II secretion system protein [Verrucomicrobiota bacterium]|nr:hypothetical protein [Verrucomicrobiales bacterium]HRI13777.1 type II secretion system protein [Verrucomicrobiota bacterium]
MDTPRLTLSFPAGCRRAIRAFTLIELLVVISIIAVLAGLVVGIAPAASQRMKDARVRSELAALVTAIESYKAKYGVYPPDNYDPTNRVTNPTLNSLYYELTGVLADNQQGKLIAEDGSAVIDPADFQRYFGREGVLNSLPRAQGTAAMQNRLDRDQRKTLLRREFKPGQYAEIFRSERNPGYVDLEVLAVGFSTDASGKRGGGFPWPPGLPPAQQPVRSNPGLNPWRYVSTNPTNNPGRFDLWAEIRERNRTNIVGNW